MLFSLSRGGWGIQGVVASRYYMDLVLFLIGVLWLLFEDAHARRDGASRLSAVACIAIAAIVFAGHAWTYRIEWYTAPGARWRSIAWKKRSSAARRPGRLAHDAGAAAVRGAGGGDHAHAQVVALPPRRCVDVRSRRVRWVDGWYDAGRHGNRWMKQAARIEAPPCSCEAKTTAYLPAGFAARDLNIVAGDWKQTLALVPGKKTPVTLPASPARRIATLSVSVATVPAKDIPGSTDKRTVGALFGPLQFDCAVPATAQ